MAISAWKGENSGDHVVHVFKGSGASWSALRVLAGGFEGPSGADGHLTRPRCLRFTGDGAGLAVADLGNNRVSLFRVDDGSFVRHVVRDLEYPYDMEECKGGWLVACGGSVHTIKFVGDGAGGESGDGDGDGRVLATIGRQGKRDGEFNIPSALALAPGLGLFVREYLNYGRVQVLATPHAIAQASMSAVRVAWMMAVVRGIASRAVSPEV